ncbi:MAG: hydrogenase maturation protease [Cyanobacteria bacterium P01_A01_bin.83]
MLTIIGCGNLNRSDDAVGAIASQRLQQFLQQHPNSQVRVYDLGTAGMEVMFQAKGAEELIIIDGCSTGSEPGTIFQVPGKELEELPEPSYSLHDFRWHHALAAGRKIFADDFPNEITVYLIELANLDFGWELSLPVQKAVDLVVRDLQQLCLTKRKCSPPS